jgi:hypothetical protein
MQKLEHLKKFKETIQLSKVAFLSFMTTSWILFAWQANSQSHASDEVVRFLSQPKLTQQQKLLFQELTSSSSLKSNVAAFTGLSPIRFSSIENETQICLTAQYIVFQDVKRSNPSESVYVFAMENLKKHDWCNSVVKSMTNQTIQQILAYDGLLTLYYVLYQDMNLRINMLKKNDSKNR